MTFINTSQTFLLLKIGTKSFPHPMVGLSYADRNRAEQNFANTNSYAAFEAIQFQPLKKAVNKWRKKELNLPPIQGHSMSTTLPDLKIPFSAMWSPSFVPKPDDWPEQCRVVGTFNFKERATNKDGDEPTPAPKFDPIAAGLGEADEWLRQEGAGKPVFIGFGSMVIENPEKLQEIITSAAAEVGCRIIVQSGWTNIDVSNCKNAEDLDKQLDFTGPLCQNIGRCPHDWLLPLCSAVVHHGGAGTTAAGLKHSLPTFVCPFFADQYMWSEMVARANVGPSPCPVKDLTKDILVERLKELTSDALKENAIKLSREMHEENGIEGGLSHLMDGVPVHNMFCDVNMLLGIVKRAHHRVVGTKIKLSDEVAAALEAVKISWSSEPLGVFRVSGLRLEQINIVDYNTVGNVQNCTHGMMYGITGCFFNTLDALLMWFTVPNRWSYRKGMCGCIFGVLWFPFKTFFRLLYACWFLLDAFLLGAYNQCAKNDREWIILPVRKSELSRVNNLSFVEERKSKILQDGFEGEDFNRLLSGYEFVKHARCAFNASSPVRSEEHKCYLVKVVDLIPAIGKIEVFESSDEKEEAIECLKECKSEKVTFTEICRILSPVVGRRINVHLKSRSRKSIFDIYNDESNDEENQSPLINRVGTGSLEKHDTVKRLIREKSRMVL